jgi:DNA repair exonuclease SbcCD ATPase subunit
MIKSLFYEVTFPTGRCLKAKLSFETGLSAITGSNEAGKTMILEMIRYGLWGSKALRGKAEDYKTLKMSLTFVVGGVTYSVHRLKGTAELYRSVGIDDAGDELFEIVATGASVVNSKIIEIFGYDMSVFDVANNIGQGEVEALGNMTPAERKRMVDQTIGLDAVDDLIDELHNDASAERKVYEALQENLAAPQEPVGPDGYLPSDQLLALQKAATVDVAKYHQVKGWLDSRSHLTEPECPGSPSSSTVAELEEWQAIRQKHLLKTKLVEDELAKRKPASHTAAEIDEMQRALEASLAYKNAQRELARFPAPVSQYDLDAEDERHHAAALDKEIAKLEAGGTVVCPECKHGFHLEHEHLATLKAERAPLTQESPTMSARDLAVAHAYHEKYFGAILTLNELRAVPSAPDVDYDIAKIAKLRAELDNDRIIAELTDQLDAMRVVVYEDRAEELASRRQFDVDLAAYKKASVLWNEYLVEKDSKVQELSSLEGCVERLEGLNLSLGAARIYEAEMNRYQIAKSLYDEQLGTVTASKAKAESYEKAKKAMKALKVNIKAHLVPSLNKVASNLLTQMTAAERNTVVVDENFGIEIDGQPLNTLSGSGKAVANLAIRIALGQVLTNRVFSVLMGDEVDASMDVNRAGYTAECLDRLTDSVSQVILVSHKSIDAEHHITVG